MKFCSIYLGKNSIYTKYEALLKQTIDCDDEQEGKEKMMLFIEKWSKFTEAYLI